MKEFTIRNKSTRPIMTLTPKMLSLLLEARPESVSLVLAKQLRDYKQLTGKAMTLDYDQELILLAHAGADARGTWTSQYANLPYPLSHVQPVFADGFMQRALSEMCDDLALAEAFHSLLDPQILPTPASK